MTRNSFIFYRSFATAAKKMPDNFRLSLYDAIIDYCLDNTLPALSDTADLAWDLIKPQLDANNKRYIDGYKGAEHGKQGGAPKGNKNAVKTKNNPTGVKLNNPTGVKLNNPTGVKKTTPNENENDNVNVNVNDDDLPDNITANNNDDDINKIPETPPPLFIDLILQEARKAGFILDRELAQRIAKSGIAPEWLEGDLNYCQFAKDKITSGAYADKPHDEQRLLFVKSFTYPNLHEEYPAWKEAKLKQAEKKAKAQEYENAKNKKPTRCICGSIELKEYNDTILCMKCRSACEFKNLKWEWQKMENEKSLSESYRDMLKRKYISASDLKPHEKSRLDYLMSTGQSEQEALADIAKQRRIIGEA